MSNELLFVLCALLSWSYRAYPHYSDPLWVIQQALCCFCAVWALALNLQHRAKMTHELSGGQAVWLHLLHLPMFTKICMRKQMFICVRVYCSNVYFCGLLHVKYMTYVHEFRSNQSGMKPPEVLYPVHEDFLTTFFNSFQKEYQWFYSLAQCVKRRYISTVYPNMTLPLLRDSRRGLRVGKHVHAQRSRWLAFLEVNHFITFDAGVGPAQVNKLKC